MHKKNRYLLFPLIILLLCAIYLTITGFMLIVAPEKLIPDEMNAEEVTGTVFPLMRTTGALILPLAILYIFVGLKHFTQKWALLVIIAANIFIISTRAFSWFSGEKLMTYAILDIPIQMISLAAAFYLFVAALKKRSDVD